MWAPTACTHTVSGSISLPSPGFFSPFPHGTGSLSVSQEYLALEDGPPIFRQDYRSEERRVGKECRSRRSTDHYTTNVGKDSERLQICIKSRETGWGDERYR